MPLILDQPPAIVVPAPRKLLKPRREILFTPAIGFIASGRFGGAATPISNTFLQVATPITGTGTNKSFTSQNFGTADATRRIVCSINWRKDVAGSVLSTVTIGGVSATIHTQTDGVGTKRGTAIVSALVPTGTSGNVDCVWASTGSRASVIALWRQLNESVSSPFASNTATTSSLTVSTTINIPSGGSLYATAATNTLATNPTFVWTGATERYDSIALDSDTGGSGASDTGMTVETGRSVQAVASGGSTPLSALSVVSWV